MTKLRHEIETAAREAFGSDPDPIEARPSDWRLILTLVACEIAVLGAFLWLVTR